MRAYSLIELFNLTHAKLLSLHAKIAAEMPSLSESNTEVALENLRNIRRVLAHFRCAPS